jgi:predicted HicB family RNase H-like nuclease
MNNIIEYKNYHAKIEYSASDNCLHGKILGIKDLVIFEGVSTEDIILAFQDSVDDYLEFCEKRGIEPSKEFSGHFNIRISSDLHRKLSTIADLKEKSLNSIVLTAIDSFIDESENKKKPVTFNVHIHQNASRIVGDKDYKLGTPVYATQNHKERKWRQ